MNKLILALMRNIAKAYILGMTRDAAKPISSTWTSRSKETKDNMKRITRINNWSDLFISGFIEFAYREALGDGRCRVWWVGAGRGDVRKDDDDVDEQRAVAMALPKNLIRPLPRAGTQDDAGFEDMLSRSRWHISDGMGEIMSSATQWNGRQNMVLNEADVSSSYGSRIMHLRKPAVIKEPH